MTVGGGLGALGALVALGAILIAFINWVVRTRHERAVAAATGAQHELAVLNAARREVDKRANSLTIGCFGAVLVGFVSFAAAIWVAAWLASVGLLPVALAIYLAPLAVALFAFWSVRRRYPSPPRPRRDVRKVIVNAVGIGVAIAALLFLAAYANQ